MKVAVEIVNAFIDGETGGNPAGVVIDAGALSAGQKLAVAGKLGLSEMLASFGKGAPGGAASSAEGSIPHAGGDTASSMSDAATKAVQKLQDAIHR